jgi:hypothetical protein
MKRRHFFEHRNNLLIPNRLFYAMLVPTPEPRNKKKQDAAGICLVENHVWTGA